MKETTMRKISISELLFHASFFCFYLYTSTIIAFIPGVSDSYGGGAKFFTRWTLYLNIVYFAFSLIVDLVNFVFAEPHRCRKFRDLLFCGTVFPANFITALVFWGIFAVNSELIFPMSIRKYVAVNGFQNHATHTAPIFSTLLECLCVYHRPPRMPQTIATWVLFSLSYFVWILWIAHHANIWAYEFLRVMDTPGKAAFFGGTFILGYLLLNIGTSILSSLRWEEAEVRDKKKKK